MKRATKIAILNAAIAGGLVFFGAFMSGTITTTATVGAAAAAGTTFLMNLKTFFENVRNKKGAVSMGVFNFYGA